MTIQYVSDVEFGSELPATQPDTSLKASSAFAKAVGYAGSGRFEDHEKAREQGLPGALVPGIRQRCWRGCEVVRHWPGLFAGCPKHYGLALLSGRGCRQSG